jgi:hypothetical protein
LHGEEYAGEVGADDLLERLDISRAQRRAAGNARIGEQDVILAELFGPFAIAASVAATSVASATTANAFGPNSFAAASSVA